MSRKKLAKKLSLLFESPATLNKNVLPTKGDLVKAVLFAKNLEHKCFENAFKFVSGEILNI